MRASARSVSAVTAVIAWRIDALFNIAPEQVATAQWVCSSSGAFLSVRFSFAIFGAVVYAFQRSYSNNAASIVTSIVVALVTVFVPGQEWTGKRWWPSNEAVRALSRLAYHLERVSGVSALHVRPSLFRRWRLRGGHRLQLSTCSSSIARRN
jgi:hypothetical protein